MIVNHHKLNWWLRKEGYIDKKQFIKNRKFIKTLPSEIGEVTFKEDRNLFNYTNEIF